MNITRQGYHSSLSQMSGPREMTNNNVYNFLSGFKALTDKRLYHSVKAEAKCSIIEVYLQKTFLCYRTFGWYLWFRYPERTCSDYIWKCGLKSRSYGTSLRTEMSFNLEISCTSLSQNNATSAANDGALTRTKLPDRNID